MMTGFRKTKERRKKRFQVSGDNVSHKKVAWKTKEITESVTPALRENDVTKKKKFRS